MNGIRWVMQVMMSVTMFGGIAVSGESPVAESPVVSATPKRPVDWVEPRIDTVKPRWFYFSSACRPFGMVNLSPDTQTKGDWNAGYRYNDDRIECFSHIHCWQLAGFAVMPVTEKTSPDDYASKFSHDDEIVRPGYHRVKLATHGITAELTSTTRVGFHRYHYTPGSRARVVLDAARLLMEIDMRDVSLIPTADRMRVEGTFTMGPTLRRPKPFTAYVVVAFEKPFEVVAGANTGKLVLDFGRQESPLLMKVALSYTGLDGARANLAAELPHWDFERVCRESDTEWNDWLGRIAVEGGSDSEKTKFYTDLWHALLGRRILSDADHRYPDNTGPKQVVRNGSRPHHNFDALWGAQWSINVLWPLAWPEVMENFASTMLDLYRNGGMIPRGPAGGNDTFVMIGDPAAAFFAAAWQKGIRGWDAETAWQGLRKNAFPGGIRSHAGYEHRPDATGGGIAQYIERGYVPEDIPGAQGMHRQGAAMTLEYAYQDWCLARLAEGLGKSADQKLFDQRAGNFRHLWDSEVGWMRPRRMDGSWYSPFEPVAEGFAAKGFVESTSAIYSFFVPHDLPGLAELFGGADRMAARLEENFRKAESKRFVADHGNHAVAWVDYENQPSTGMAHVFGHIGQPWRSQYWVRRVHRAAFSDSTPFGGYNGDEDQGQMGALSALMAIGLFDMSGGAAKDPSYDLTAPLFERVSIRLPKGGVFEIRTRNQGPDHVYIQSATLDGKDWNDFRLPHRLLKPGSVLELTLSAEPNRSWGGGRN